MVWPGDRCAGVACTIRRPSEGGAAAGGDGVSGGVHHMCRGKCVVQDFLGVVRVKAGLRLAAMVCGVGPVCRVRRVRRVRHVWGAWCCV